MNSLKKTLKLSIGVTILLGALLSQTFPSALANSNYLECNSNV